MGRGGLYQKSTFFCLKNVSFRQRAEQTGATPVQGRFLDFLEEIMHFNVIWITFRTFLEPIERTKLLDSKVP